MKKLKSKALELLRDESGQGTAEYVLILVGVLGAAMLFKRQIGEILGKKMGDLGGKISVFTAN